ncbi:MAG: peptide ABC transporter substrate-binding protein, partial [Planctomycetes bacterium]|nr:peptide ABC transporter substrate-binding protein [Planctomycetota bacterium]
GWVKPERFVCNGPFKPVMWKLRDRIRVERNPRYREAHRVTLRSIDWLATDSPSTQLNLYMEGACDIITEVPTSAVPELMRRYGPNATGEFSPTARLGTFFFRINTTRAPFTNPKLRRALSLAVDRDAIVKNVTRAGEAPARSFVPPGTGCGDTVYEPPLVCHHDLELARRLLAEGLAEEGLTPSTMPVFEVLYSQDVTDQAIAEVLQDQWETLGVRCRLVNMDSGSIRSAVRELDYAIARSSWIGDFNDPSNFLDLFVTGSGGNRTGFTNAAYDRDVGERAPAAQASARRSAILREAEERLLREAPIIPIYHYVSRAMVKPWVKGFSRNVLDWHPPRWLRIER